MAIAKKTTTGMNATLLRGRSYSLVHPFDRRRGTYHFKKGEARLVQDPQVVEYLRDLTEVVTDTDGAETDKPMFRITAVDAEATKGSTSRRAAPVEEEDDEPRRGARPRPRRLGG